MKPVHARPGSGGHLRRGVLCLAAVAVVGGAGTVVGATSAKKAGTPASTPEPSPRVRILFQKRVVVDLPIEQASRAGLLAQVSRKVPLQAIVDRGPAKITVRYARGAAVDAAMRSLPVGGDTQVRATPISARVPAPAVQQERRNTCESAALHILLATIGRPVSQRTLQEALPTSGGPDPVMQDGVKIWGDPEIGYVGRPDGGGVAGGFGVLVGPVKQAAAKFDVELEDLTGKPASVVYRRLRAGRAVMVWIGLSDGPYGSWTSPEGRPVKVNFGEHTVVLHGIDAEGNVEVSNPLQGTRERWTQGEFELQYDRLGKRALATT